MKRELTRDLRRLAALYRVQTSFINMRGERQWAKPEALCAVLRELGAPLTTADDARSAIRHKIDLRQKEFLAPVIVAWDGESEAIRIRIPADDENTRINYTLSLESGEVLSGVLNASSAATVGHCQIGAGRFDIRTILPHRRLPFGYHRLRVQLGSMTRESLVIAAPLRANGVADDRDRHAWGLFAPLYSLRSDRNWGIGDFTDAEALVVWMADQGGHLFSTLPYLASYLDAPCDPSPYTPASRLFWNELFIDPTRLPELSSCAAAQELITSVEFQNQMRLLRSERLVDYRAAMALKKQVLTLLTQQIKDTGGQRLDALNIYVSAHQHLEDYAQFRAVTSRQQAAWPRWPERERDGDIRDGDFDPREMHYHLYVQFAAAEQIRGLERRCRADGVDVYLDFPLGTHTEGYDVWRYREVFGRGCSVGAPPDPVFTSGQDWGFPPLLPEAQRQSGYEYMIACLRHQLRHATMLRLDHVMGLHRSYWIPRGFRGTDGVYVRYPADEMYAVTLLEAHRAGARLIGENLGIVPGYVNRALDRHALVGMNVAYWELAVDPDGAMQRIAERPRTVASLNTHDMFPFAAFWSGEDIDVRERLGIVTSDQAAEERRQRDGVRAQLSEYIRRHGLSATSQINPEDSLQALLLLLGKSAAEYLLINLEDLWLESSPQNIPSTVDEYPNWRQKTRLSVEEIIRSEPLQRLLRDVAARRSRRAVEALV